MARVKYALPRKIILLYIVLMLLAWWIEDGLIYYVNWHDFALVRLAGVVVVNLKIDRALAFIREALIASGHLISDAAANSAAAITSRFNTLPSTFRERAPLRFLAWCGRSLIATFSGDAVPDFGRGLWWTLGKLATALIAFNAAAWIYNLVHSSKRLLRAAGALPMRLYGERDPEVAVRAANFAESNGAATGPTRQRRREYIQFFDQIEKIGIILPGGGAAGAYQAGALKAIHEFLRDYNVLRKVSMIAGTSTGAWNAMFWLANLIETGDEDAPDIQRWWMSMTFGAMADFPWFSIPFWSDAIARPTPWREQFDRLFGNRLDYLFEPDSPIHFYLSRADVERGVVEYSTNWPGVSARIDELGFDHDDNYRFCDVIESGKESLAQTADAVFASISMPPLLSGAMSAGPAFEDAGALDGIPLRFAAPLENCDLVFILPTVGAAAPVPGTRPLVRRMIRSAELRQSALANATIKGADLINRLSERMERIDFGISALATALPNEGIAAEALAGLREELSEYGSEYRRLYTFTVCPGGAMELDQFGFWDRPAVENAFDLMYAQTRRELQNRLFEDIELDDAHVVLVDGALPTSRDLPKPIYRRPAQL